MAFWVYILKPILFLLTFLNISSVLSTVTTEPLVDVFNVTLDYTTNDSVPTWKISNPNSNWFEYYSNVSELKEGHSDPTLCPSVFSNIEGLNTNVTGIWLACQDMLNQECDTVGLPCQPEIEFKQIHIIKDLRTLVVSFALQGLGILRLIASNSDYCLDISLREDPFSRCQFRQVNVNAKNWQQEIWSIDPILYTPITFATFKLEFISRFKGDVVLLDKIEATELLLCNNTQTTCKPPPIIPETPTTQYTGNPTTITTTLDPHPYITDKPWVSTVRTTPTSASNSLQLSIELCFVVLFLTWIPSVAN